MKQAKDLSIVNINFKIIGIREAHHNKTVLNMAIIVNPIFREIKQIATEAEAVAVDLSILEDVVVVGPIIRIVMEHISITCMIHNQNNMALPAVYTADLIILLSIVTRENMIETISRKRSVSILINLNRAIYISNGDHDNPHEPPQKELEGCDISQNTLYSHQVDSVKDSDDFEKLYIYQHFQESEKMHQIEPESELIATDDNSLYPYVNNNIEYGLFEDIVDSYYLDR